jgi:hypothetical protein
MVPASFPAGTLEQHRKEGTMDGLAWMGLLAIVAGIIGLTLLYRKQNKP